MAEPANQAAGSEGGAKGLARSTITHRAYQELKRLIHFNILKPGDTFPQLALAKRLGISRTPLRDAATRLEDERLVELRPRRGVHIRPITLVDLAELYEVLTALESHAARRTAEKGAPAESFSRLVAAHEAMERAVAGNDVNAWIAADQQFHTELVIASGNEHLRYAVTGIWERLSRVRLVMLPYRSASPESNLEHASLLEAIRRRDGAGAFDAHFRHRERAAGVAIDLLRRNGITQL